MQVYLSVRDGDGSASFAGGQHFAAGCSWVAVYLEDGAAPFDTAADLVDVPALLPVSVSVGGGLWSV